MESKLIKCELRLFFGTYQEIGTCEEVNQSKPVHEMEPVHSDGLVESINETTVAETDDEDASQLKNDEFACELEANDEFDADDEFLKATQMTSAEAKNEADDLIEPLAYQHEEKRKYKNRFSKYPQIIMKNNAILQRNQTIYRN